MNIVIVEDKMDRAFQCAQTLENLQKDINIIKIFIFKKENQYNLELGNNQGFRDAYGDITERVDLWNCFERFDEMYLNEDNVFLMDWGLEGDGSREIVSKSVSVIYARSKINGDDNIIDRFFIYTSCGSDTTEELNELLPNHIINCDILLDGIALRYDENERFCQLFGITNVGEIVNE